MTCRPTCWAGHILDAIHKGRGGGILDSNLGRNSFLLCLILPFSFLPVQISDFAQSLKIEITKCHFFCRMPLLPFVLLLVAARCVRSSGRWPTENLPCNEWGHGSCINKCWAQRMNCQERIEDSPAHSFVYESDMVKAYEDCSKKEKTCVSPCKRCIEKTCISELIECGGMKKSACKSQFMQCSCIQLGSIKS